MKALLEKIRKLLRDRKFRRTWYRIVSGFAAIVVFVTTYALVLPAITLEKTAACGIEEHQHDESCYEERLICGQEESDGHHHDESCYEVTKELVCGQEEHQHTKENGCYDEEGNLICELAEHTHDDSCYKEVKTLICGQEESEGHHHTDACYEKVLVCGKEAHIHSEKCYKTDSSAVAATEEAAGSASTVTSGGSNSADSDNADNTVSENAAEDAAAGMTDTTADAAVSDSSVPTLDPVDMDAVLTKNTGFYYFHAEEDEEIPADSADITDWQQVKKDTKLESTDLVKMYLSYTIPAGSLNETNATARYRLPGNIHLTDDQIKAINHNENGIYASMDSEADARKYLGAEAVEGDRKPDEELKDGAQEYISAVVKAENVYNDDGKYLGQDLIFTFVPYTIEKNQNTYDADGSQLTAGKKITGWFACDFNMSQIDWVEEEGDLDNSTVEKTAECIFAAEDKENNIDEISRTLKLVEQNTEEKDTEKEDADTAGTEETAAEENAGDGSSENSADAGTDDSAEASTEKTEEDAAEAAQEYKSGTLTADGDGYKITLDYTEEAKIPENAELSVKEITAETDKEAYEACLEQAEKHVAESDKEKTGVNAEASRFFDIEILVKEKKAAESIVSNGSVNSQNDGEETVHKIEPATPVNVNIQILDFPVSVSEDVQQADPTVIHFAEDGVEKIESTADEVTVDHKNESGKNSDDGAATEVIFEAESFSVYGVVYTVDFHYEVNGQHYDISFTGGDSVSFRDLLIALHVIEEADDEDSTQQKLDSFINGISEMRVSDESLLQAVPVTETITSGELKKALGIEAEYSAQLTDKQIEAMDSREFSSPDWALFSLKPFNTEERITVWMKNGETFTINVTDAQIANIDQVDSSKGYILYTIVNNEIFVLDENGTTWRVPNMSDLDTMGNEYKWNVSYVYTEYSTGVKYYNIHPVNYWYRSITLNNEDEDVVQIGRNNLTITPNNGGFIFEGYTGVKLSNLNYVENSETETGTFIGDRDSGSTIYIYEQGEVNKYKFAVRSNDYAMGKVSGTDANGDEIKDVAEYDTITSLNKKNNYIIKAEPQSGRYEFDHWELNGETLTGQGATIDANTLTIPYSGSKLEAFFKKNEGYIVPDEEKEGRVIDKESLDKWLSKLTESTVPLNPDGCKKTAEVYDYENRIYRVDLTSQSSLAAFDGTIDLGFIIDVSGSMQFPSKLDPIEGMEYVNINAINTDSSVSSQFDTSKVYYVIADKAGTATVYRIFYDTVTERNWEYNYNTGWHLTESTKTGWRYVDASYANSSAHYIDANSTFSNDPAGTYYPIYKDGDNGKKRLNYLMDSINGTISELQNILGTISVAKDGTKNPDVKIAWNTFAAEVKDQHHTFTSVNGNLGEPDWDTAGGTGTDLALEDAKDFNWEDSSTKYAVLITDGAPQRGGVAIANSVVKTAADDLRNGTDGTANTDDDINLITVGLSMGDVKRGSVLLYDIANRDEEGEPYFYKAESGDELQYVLYEIINKIMKNATVVGDVTDTINEAFYIVDKATGQPLQPTNKIDLQGNLIPEGEEPEGGYGIIQEDGRTVKWTNQDFTWEGWHGTVFVKAKEDLLGGNAVLTNDGNARIAANYYKNDANSALVELASQKLDQNGNPDPKYQKVIDNLDSPRVNVNELAIDKNKTEWTVYLGETVDPVQQIKKLYESIQIKETVTTASDTDGDGLPDLVVYESDGTEAKTNKNMRYPLTESISDQRLDEEKEEAVIIQLKNLIKTLVVPQGSGNDSSDWWDYQKQDLKWDDLITMANGADAENIGFTIPYDAYGLGDGYPDDSFINIKLTKEVKENEPGLDPSPHATAIVGDGVEKYTLTVLYSPDYAHVPVGQGGDGTLEYHTGTFGKYGYQGHAAGKEERANTHVINVYAEPLDVYKIDNENNVLPGASFALYREKEGDETGISLSQYTNTLQGDNYYCISSGVSDDKGIVHLAPVNDGDTAKKLLVPGKTYYLIETDVPEGYLRDPSVKIVRVETSEGVYTGLNEENIEAPITSEKYPFDWNQGVRILVDGKAVVARVVSESQTQEEGSQTGEDQNQEAAQETIQEEILGENQYVYKADPVTFRTTIINNIQYADLDVTKVWTDSTSDVALEEKTNKAQNGYTITFKVTKKHKTASGGVQQENGTETSPEDVLLTVDNIPTAATNDYITFNPDNHTITLTYHDGWPVAELEKLLRYTDNTGTTEWIYEVVETGHTANEKNVTFNKTEYISTDSDGKKTITIVNVEESKIHIHVQKKWLDADGNEMSEAPEKSVTFELYRVARTPCEHVWGEWQVTKNPTCKEKGSRKRTCLKECGAYEEEEIETIPHTWSEWKIIKEADYKEDGLKRRECTVCGEVEEEIITMKPHDHVWDELQIDCEPDCETDGLAHKKCSLCDKVSEETVVLPKLGHDMFETIDPAPKCEQEGTRIYKCSRCGKTITEIIPPLGHNYEEDKEKYVAPTCKTEGSITYVCSRCNDTYTETISKLQHKWNEGVVTKQPTVDELGEMTYTCELCGDTKTEDIAKLEPEVETFPGTDIVLEVVTWPEVTNENQNLQYHMDPTGIFKTDDGYCVVYHEVTKDRSQYRDGPGKGGMQNDSVFLTGTIWNSSTFANQDDGRNSRMTRGDLYIADDGTAYVFINTSTWAAPPTPTSSDWYKIPGTGASASSGYYNPNKLMAFVTPHGKVEALVQLDGSIKLFGKGVDSLTPEQKTRIETLLGITVKARDELENLEQTDNLNIAEFVGSYTIGNNGVWTWDSGDLDGFDKDGLEYTYYVVETNPASGYEITYEGQNEGLKDNGTAIIKNKLNELSIKIKKKIAGTENPLPGASFTLTQVDADGHNVAGGIQKTTDYSGADGTIIVTGLKTGRYKLEESGIPGGYVQSEGPYYINITANGEDTIDNSTDLHYIDYEKVDKDHVYTVQNEPGAELPSTGGPGTHLYYLLGIMLLGFAGLGLIMAGRKGKVL